MTGPPSVEKFVDTVPEKWMRDIKPIILKAFEFEKAKQPLVAYYLQTYAMFRAMELHRDPANKADKPSTTPYLMSFLDHLEALKSSPTLAAMIDENDGRTVLTKTALQLFAKADDAERTGMVSEGVVKLFFSSTILFEATKQYIDDATMDPICAEKHKYATIVAVKMKKALVSKQPYISPNGAKELPAPSPQDGEFPLEGSNGATPPTPTPAASTGGYGGYVYNPTPQQQQQKPPTPPPQYSPPPPAPSPQVVRPQQPTPTNTTPNSTAVPQYNCQQQYATALSSGGLAAPGHAQIFEAQKQAKQAVSALQFHDHTTAKKHLLAALATLDGTPK